MPTPMLKPGHPRWPEVEQAWQLYQSGMIAREVADRIGQPQGTVEHWIKIYPKRAEDPAIAEAKAAVGTRMTPTLAWAKTKSEDGTSYSVLLKPEPVEDDTLDRIREAFEGMQPAAPVAPPEKTMAELCTLYPVMDVHFGMQAWGRETGHADYDIRLASEDMRHAFHKVTALTPNSREAILLLGGDFFHADDDRAETPQSKHKLQVDGRHFKVLDRGIQIVAEIVDRLLRKHEKITVRVLRGNHDPHSHLVLTFSLAERYREELRVDVDKSPMDLFMRQWGRCLIAAHHGDRGKPEQLTHVISDICPYWSATRHRYCFTGHTHRDRAHDFGPLRWESLRAFAPPDSYGSQFPSRRQLQAVTFHDVDGLVLRAFDPIERAA